ncbi:Zinc ribbon domain-containing protein OS=Streptomyces fumanus OX=67302 GN=GCM10018772_02010 PE=4 SV=1 [Streptomyces fumanus]
MDYCHPCRRHLNGALTCPGCGTPVDRPSAGETEPPPGPPREASATAIGPRGRASAAHRGRRRTLLVTTGLVLAAAGVGLAELGTDAPAAPAPPAAESPAPRPPQKPESHPAEPAAGLSVPSGSRPSGASASPSAPPSTPTDTPSETPEGAAPESPTAPSVPAAPAESAPAPPAQTALLSPPPPATTAPAPAPTTMAPAPTPTETCDRFLWWCA